MNNQPKLPPHKSTRTHNGSVITGYGETKLKAIIAVEDLLAMAKRNQLRKITVPVVS